MSIDIKNNDISFGDKCEVDLWNLYNVVIKPNETDMEMYEYNNHEFYKIKLVLYPKKTTKYIVEGINDKFEFISLDFIINVKMSLSTNELNLKKNDSGFIEINTNDNLLYYPNKNIEKITKNLYKVNPLVNTKYTITNIDDFNQISTEELIVKVDNDIVFNPEEPKVLSGNILTIDAKLDYEEKSFYEFKWRSTHSIRLPEEFSGIKYGDSITIHPYFSIAYIVEAITKDNNVLTSKRIDIKVIPKPVDILDNDIIPEILYTSVINRNSIKVKELLLENRGLLYKIINFYYRTITNAYRTEMTNKNGSQIKVPWIAKYNIDNEINDMIVTFEQQWGLYMYINRYKTNYMNLISNFGFLLKNVNELINDKRTKGCIN